MLFRSACTFHNYNLTIYWLKTRGSGKLDRKYTIKLNDGTIVNLEDDALSFKIGFIEVTYYEVLL